MNKFMIMNIFLLAVVLGTLCTCALPGRSGDGSGRPSAGQLGTKGQAAVMEVGLVTVAQTIKNQWHTVTLKNVFKNPVVVMGPVSFNDPLLGEQSPCVARVRNITSNSFEFQVDEWDYLDGVHEKETVAYMVVEQGLHMVNGMARPILTRSLCSVSDT